MNTRRLTFAACFIATVLASLSYLGSIGSSAVWTFVLPGAAIAAVATLLPRKPSTYAGLVSGFGCGMIWAVVVNGLSGENLGPVARSTTACIAGVTLVVFGLRRKEPNTTMIGHLLILFGALYYGAANEVWKLALVASIFQLAGYIGISLDAQRRKPADRSRREYLLLLILLLGSIVIVLTTPWSLSGVFQRNDARVSPVVINTEVTPPWDSARTTTTSVSVTTTTFASTTSVVQTTTTVDSTKEQKKTKESRLWLWIFLVLLAVTFATLARLMYVRIMNRSLFQRLKSEDNQESVRLSWNWTNALLAQYGFETSTSISVDRVASSLQVRTWPTGMRTSIEELASLAELAIFSNRLLSDEETSSAWNASSRLISAARDSSSRPRRVIVPFMRVRL
jgi:hypothetical protein